MSGLGLGSRGPFSHHFSQQTGVAVGAPTAAGIIFYGFLFSEFEGFFSSGYWGGGGVGGGGKGEGVGVEGTGALGAIPQYIVRGAFMLFKRDLIAGSRMGGGGGGIKTVAL